MLNIIHFANAFALNVQNIHCHVLIVWIHQATVKSNHVSMVHKRHNVLLLLVTKMVLMDG